MSNNKPNRRQFLGTLGMLGAGAMLGSCAVTAAPSKPNLDIDVLNFALNLEYLEAEFYLWAAFGAGLSNADAGGGPAATGGKKATLSAALQQRAEEIARDEEAHVKALRATITKLGGTPVARPQLDIGPAFAAAADAASGGKIKGFSPYTNDLFFAHGAFIFEDVGVTAYSGAATLITSPDVLQAAAGILAVEAYHAGEIRSYLYDQKDTVVVPGLTVEDVVAAISALRGSVGGGKDEGITKGGKANIVAADANAIAYHRTTREVLNIVYLAAGATKGGFFPNGLNGNIK
ncbi:ferritin-like domain-containing protein [Deinococcus roseus]|uniref:Dessication-associated protein n=1 Tax=Deinococcus roseus TaxID=392414 RepID=A0ABQ2D1L1_9DEIO|nr:ferritin-like domain-containing protein [Deinococcus roseus]GGJ42028.1 hypothetical protein GCM10008938_30090 [Deinococcus roseus]